MPTTPAAKPRHANQHPPALTKARQDDILRLIALSGRISQSCEQVGLDPGVLYGWATRSVSFSKRLDEAKARGEKAILAHYEHNLDTVCLDREIDKDPELYAKVQNSMFFRMKRLDPAYRDNAQVQILATGPLALMSSLAETRPQLPSKPTRKDPKP